MNNQRGGVISNIIIIPVAAVLMIGFFFLGYYVGKYQSRSGNGPADAGPPLPEVISKNIPKPDEFTFYKTLSDKSDKTVSIDLHPSSSGEKKGDVKKADTDAGTPEKGAQRTKNDAMTEGKQTKQPPSARKETASKGAGSSKIRYTLQIASYQEKEMAEGDIKKMKQRGYAAFIVASELPGKGTWYRVRLGSFSSKGSAEKLQRELRAKEGISPIITME